MDIEYSRLARACASTRTLRVTYGPEEIAKVELARFADAA